MADNKKYLDLSGLGYAIRKMNTKKADIESPDFTGTPTINNESIITDGNIDSLLDEKLTETLENKIVETVGDQLDLKANIKSPEFTGIPTAPAAEKGDKSSQIANTKWVDDNYISKQGDAVVDGTLIVIGNKYPLLTLKDKATNVASGHYLMNIQGNLMFGDCTSNNASRQYYGRMVPLLGKAVVGAVAIGYNPKDDKNYSKTTDYGLKFDIDAAASTSATPTIQHQAASFFVGVNGAYIGYSGNINQKLNYDTQIYRILDSNSIKKDEYIQSLENRIADLENKLALMLNEGE